MHQHEYFAVPVRVLKIVGLVPGAREHLIAGFNRPAMRVGGPWLSRPAPDAVDRSVKAGDRTII
jgi:hypothetical protein